MKNSAEKTFDSVKKINDFPFYTATYYGDYKLTEFKNGAIDSPEIVVPFFEDLFQNLGAPIKLKFPGPQPGHTGCSAFFCKTKEGDPLLGKNLDWQKAPILLLQTRPEKGYKSLSLVNLDFCDLFNTGQFNYKLLLAPYVPLDGINENGLAITMLSVYKDGGYANRPGNISVGDFNIIRIILDSCINIDEAKEMFHKYNLMQTAILPIHYLMADNNKSCIVEFNNKEPLFHESDKINYLTNFKKLENPDYELEKSTCPRYRKIEEALLKTNILEKKDARILLNNLIVHKANYETPSTIWSILYDLEAIKITIRIGINKTLYTAKLQNSD